MRTHIFIVYKLEERHIFILTLPVLRMICDYLAVHPLKEANLAVQSHVTQEHFKTGSDDVAFNLSNIQL